MFNSTCLCFPLLPLLPFNFSSNPMWSPVRWGQRCTRLKRSSKIESTLDETNRFASVYPPEMGWPAPGKEVSHLRTMWCTKLINRMLLEKCAGELEVRQTGVAWPWHQTRWRALIMGWNQVTSQSNQFHSSVTSLMADCFSGENLLYFSWFFMSYQILLMSLQVFIFYHYYCFGNALKHFGPKWQFFLYFYLSISLTLQATQNNNRAFSPTALLSFMAASLLVANRGQWGDWLGISDYR